MKPANEQVLVPLQKSCPDCGRAMRIRYTNRRAVVSLRGLVCLRLKIRHCELRALPSGMAAGGRGLSGAAAA